MSARSSYEKTADAQIRVGGAVITSFLVVTDGTNAATLIIYDVADSGDVAAGNKVCEWTVTGTDNQGGRNWFEPVQCKNGIYCDITGTGASYIIEYRNA